MQRQPAIVVFLQFDPMADANQRDMCEFVLEKLHHRVLTCHIQCRRRLVHEDNVRPLYKQPSEADPLLFAARQNLVPLPSPRRLLSILQFPLMPSITLNLGVFITEQSNSLCGYNVNVF